MADEVDIEPEFEDEDEFLNRISQRPEPNTPDTTAPTGSPPVDEDVSIPPTTTKFTPGAANKKNKAEIEQAQRDAARRRRAEQAEARRILREQQADIAREQRIQAKEAQRLSRDQVTAARSEAIAGRIQSYSLSASLGFPGYVTASVVDSLLLRPREEGIVAKEKQYQLELQRYNEALRREQLEQRRRREDEIRNAPITATALDDSGQPIVPGTGGIPPVPPTPPGTGSSGPNQPPLIPPVKPTTKAPSATVAGIGNAAIILTAGIQALQTFNKAVTSVGNDISATATNVIKGDVTEATKSSLKTTQSIIDPLGTNIPLTVAVQSFDILLDTNKAILEATKQNIAFAPQSLQAEVEGDIKKLVQSIESTKKNDNVTAQLIRANTQFELAWGEARAELIQKIGPALIKGLELLTWILDVIRGISTAIYIIATQIPGIGRILRAIMANTEKENVAGLDDSDILNQIDTFFDSNKQKQKMRANNTFPTP